VPLPREHLLDELATAYVQAGAALAGATFAVPSPDYGVDGILSRVVRTKRTRLPGDKFVPDGAAIEFQLKGTTAAAMRGDRIVYDLGARNYDLIVGRPRIAAPLYLFLVCFATDVEKWVAIEDEQLILNASAYWWRQSGSVTENLATVRIAIPVSDRLTPRAIEQMFEASKNRFGLQ